MQFVKMLMNEECDELRKSQEELKSDFDDLLDHLKTQLGNIRYDSEISKKIAKNELSAFEIAIKKEFNHKLCMSAHISKVLLQNFKLMMSEMDLLKSHNELLTAEIESLKTSNGILMAEIDLLKSTAKPVHCPVETSIESDSLKNNMLSVMLTIVTSIKSFEKGSYSIEDFCIRPPELGSVPGFIHPKYDSLFYNCPELLHTPFISNKTKLVVTKIGEPLHLEKHLYREPSSGNMMEATWGMNLNGIKVHYAVELIEFIPTVEPIMEYVKPDKTRRKR